MEDRTRQLEEPQRELKTGSGSLLASARKQQNRTVEEIADELNLSITQIKTIELDQSEGLPEPTYVRGYIRSYAKLLNLEPEVVLKNYLNPHWQKTSSLDDLPRGIGSADRSDKKPFLTPAKAITVVVLAASIGFLWYSGLLASLLNSTSNDAPNSVQSAPAKASSDSEAGDKAQVNREAIVDEGAGENAAEPQSSEALADADQNELVLSFAQTSWVDIRDGQDNRLAYKSYAEGEELRVSSDDSMSVFIGNAEGVSVQYNGESFDLSEYREGVYAKFTLTGESE